MKTNLFLLLAAGLAAAGCGQQEAEVLPKPHFEREKTLQVEKVAVGEAWDLSDMVVKNGYLAVCGWKSDPLLHFYSVPDLKFAGATGRNGRGPEEFPFFPFVVHTPENEFHFYGYGGRGIRKLSVGTEGVRADTVFDLSFYETFNQMHLVRDSVLVYSRLPEEFVIRKYDLKNDALLDELTIEREEDAERGSFEPNMGRIAVNDSYLIFVYQYKDRIDIYDIDDLRLLRRIEGDYKKQVPEPGNEELYYIGAVAGEDRFYVLYKGERIDGKARSNTVEVYDYQGRPIVRYRFAGLPPLYFFPDEQSGFIYGYYPAQADSLLRYKI